MYHLIHSGYGIIEDTFFNQEGTLIDGQLIQSIPIREENKIIGYRPSCGNKTNSDYMSLYSEPFVKQVRQWLQNESLVPLARENPVSHFLGPVQIFKSTIEPNKPR